jgi:hypothetical protein
MLIVMTIARSSNISKNRSENVTLKFFDHGVLALLQDFAWTYSLSVFKNLKIPPI